MNFTPPQLFIIDGFGALLSVFSLGIVLVRFENLFGIPASTLYVLAFVPCLFVIYDFCCYWLVKQNRQFFLKGIAFGNLLYSILSVSLVAQHQNELTFLGWAYIILEIIIILILVRIELKVANQ